MTHTHRLGDNDNWLEDAQLTILRQIRSDHEERWQVSNRLCRSLVREATISRLLLAALFAMKLGEYLAANQPIRMLLGAG